MSIQRVFILSCDNAISCDFSKLFYGKSLRSVDADEYNIKELNKLPDEVDDQEIWIDPLYQQQFQQQMISIAYDQKIYNELEYGDRDLLRQQHNQLQSAEFWTVLRLKIFL